jgi:hypothetical protein
MSLKCCEIISGFLSWEVVEVLVVLVTYIAHNFRQTARQTDKPADKDRQKERKSGRDVSSPITYTHPNLTSSGTTYL